MFTWLRLGNLALMSDNGVQGRSGSKLMPTSRFCPKYNTIGNLAFHITQEKNDYALRRNAVKRMPRGGVLLLCSFDNDSWVLLWGAFSNCGPWPGTNGTS